MKARWKIFDEPAPDGWTPNEGETVRLRRVAGTISAVVGFGVVQVVDAKSKLCRVKVKYGPRVFYTAVAFADLRPVKARQP